MTNEEILRAFSEILKALESTHYAIKVSAQWSEQARALSEACEHMERVRELLPEHLLARLGRDI